MDASQRISTKGRLCVEYCCILALAEAYVKVTDVFLASVGYIRLALCSGLCGQCLDQPRELLSVEGCLTDG